MSDPVRRVEPRLRLQSASSRRRRSSATSRGVGATACPDPHVEPWPAAVRVALVVTSCGAFWSVVGASLLHAFAR